MGGSVSTIKSKNLKYCQMQFQLEQDLNLKKEKYVKNCTVILV